MYGAEGLAIARGNALHDPNSLREDRANVVVHDRWLCSCQRQTAPAAGALRHSRFARKQGLGSKMDAGPLREVA